MHRVGTQFYLSLTPDYQGKDINFTTLSCIVIHVCDFFQKWMYEMKNKTILYSEEFQNPIKSIGRSKIGTSDTDKYDCSLYWFGTVTLIKSGRANRVLWSLFVLLAIAVCFLFFDLRIPIITLVSVNSFWKDKNIFACFTWKVFSWGSDEPHFEWLLQKLYGGFRLRIKNTIKNGDRPRYSGRINISFSTYDTRRVTHVKHHVKSNERRNDGFDYGTYPLSSVTQTVRSG